MSKKRFVLIHGPTGVGKSAIVSTLGKSAPIEIINCDVGQLYEPLSIGTAKPDWKHETVPHHLFDVLREPKNFSVGQYRRSIIKTMESIWQRGTIPVLVGGSGFYGKSLFFPPRARSSTPIKETGATWQELHRLDPKRAASIHKNDTYRIQRAFNIIQHDGMIPSAIKPFFDPLPGDCLLVFLTRNRDELYERINQRTEQMLAQGWLDEVKKLIDTPWEIFLERKKLIGYTEVLYFLKQKKKEQGSYERLIQTIAQKTRHYAKRQETFWRMFKKLIRPYFVGTCSSIVEINLSQNGQLGIFEERLKQFLS